MSAFGYFGSKLRIAAKLHDAMKSALSMPVPREQIAKLSLLPLDTPSIEDMQIFVKSEIARWAKIVQQAGIAGSE